MIAGILFEWNVLTATLAAWLGTVLITVAADFGPEIYRENKARAQLLETVTRMAEQRKAAKPIMFHPDATMKLGVYNIQKPAVHVRRRHAKMA